MGDECVYEGYRAATPIALSSDEYEYSQSSSKNLEGSKNRRENTVRAEGNSRRVADSNFTRRSKSLNGRATGKENRESCSWVASTSAATGKRVARNTSTSAKEDAVAPDDKKVSPEARSPEENAAANASARAENGPTQTTADDTCKSSNANDACTKRVTRPRRKNGARKNGRVDSKTETSANHEITSSGAVDDKTENKLERRSCRDSKSNKRYVAEAPKSEPKR